MRSNDLKIKSAAIKYRLKGTTSDSDFLYITGSSHSNCLNTLGCMDLYSYMRDMDAEEQGFMTTDGEFVDRYMAKKIAMNAGQISSSYPHELLYSEFIKY